MLKVASIILLSAAISVAVDDEEVVIEVNEKGCPLNNKIFKILPHENCNEFYQCVAGEPIALRCPDGLLYNRNVGVCDWPNQVNCENKLITTTSSSNENSDEPASICARNDSDGLLIPHEYCNRLYLCARGSLIDITCPKPLLFNVEQQLCDWETNVDCGDRLRGNETPEVVES